MRHSDRRVLVAGGTGALGRAVTLAFLEQGATVAVTGRRREGYERLAAAAGNDRARLTLAEGDVADALEASRMVEDLVSRHGRLDVLVNAVGAYEGGSPVWETEPERLRRMLAANLEVGFALARAAAPHMMRQRQGWIVEVASQAALHPAAGAAAYAASKAAAVALFAALAEELRPHGVRVATLAPGLFDTPANRAAMPAADHAAWTQPEHIARVVLFLCSEEARALQAPLLTV